MGALTRAAGVVAGVASLVAALGAGTGAASADPGSAGRSSTATMRTAAVGLPAAGSWAIGYSAVLRASGANATSQRLELVGPSGGVAKTLSTSMSRGSTWVEDLRFDGRRLITSEAALVNGVDATRFTAWDVTTGGRAVFTLTGQHEAFFTSTGVLTQDWSNGATRGRLQLRDNAGRLVRSLPMLPGGEVAQVSPGGTLVMQRVSAGIALRRASDGSVVRTIPRPAGETECSPRGLWGQGYVKMYCDDEATARVYAVSTTGGQPIPVTPRGYSEAWPTTGQRSVYRPGDGSGSVGYLVGSAFVPYVPAPDPVQDGLGAHGRDIWIHDVIAGWVKRQDVVGGGLVSVAGPGSSIGGVVDAARVVDTVN